MSLSSIHRLAVVFAMTIPAATRAAPDDTNYDESKVPEFTLPDPLVMRDGTMVTGRAQWIADRRPEILEDFREHMFGRMPGRPTDLRFEVFDDDDDALDGKAIRRQVTVFFAAGDDAPSMDVLLYIPKDAKSPVPVFFGLNFRGNHAIHPDPAIRLSERWMDKGPHVTDHRATPAARGTTASRWPIEMILDRGYAVATAYRGDIDPDFDDGFKNGVHALYPELQGRGDNFATIAAWAWGLSRMLDYLETDPAIDATRAAVIGHSRLGKAALWAGAEDQRIAMVVSNDSGCGGAALSRRKFGETVARINSSFPHWFCGNFKNYNDNENALPVDQHMLVALMAPRPVCIGSAEDDRWADPRGEYLSGFHASPVYALFDRAGLMAPDSPPVGQPLHDGWIGYHLRAGKHDLTATDWQAYLDFADKRLR